MNPAPATRPDSERRALLARGAALFEAGDGPRALEVFQQGMSGFPSEWRFPCNAAAVLHGERNFAEALRLLNRAIRLEPTSPYLHHLMGSWLLELGNVEVGIRILERAVALDADNLENLLHLGTAYLGTKQAARAEEIADHAVAKHPDHAGPYLLRGFVLAAQGKSEESELSMRRSIELDPCNGQAYHHLARRGRILDAEPIERLLDDPTLPVDSARRLHFALGDIYDRTGRFELAFQHFERANLMVERRWRPEGNRQMTRDIAAICTGEYIERLTVPERAGHAPIFIVGMPRTGSSLLEQILAEHPDVHAVGEHMLGTPRLVRQFAGLRPGVRGFPAGLCDLTAEDIGVLAQRYLDSLPAPPRPGLRVVDKMLANFQMLGMLAPMFPDAKVVNCRRDPRDCALSAYFLEFQGNEIPWSYDLEHFAGFHEDYVLLMKHWREHLPLSILDVRYEELVAEPEEWTRRVLEFCELDWDERCLAHEENDRQVFTASALQVREKIHTRAVARWKPYEAFLGGLQRAGDQYWAD